METGWIFAGVATVSAIVVVLLMIFGVSDSMRRMYRFEGLTWPHGVQEDDDFAWRWSSPPPARPLSDGSGSPDLADDASASAPTQRLRPRVHAGSSGVRWGSWALYPSRSARERS
jgi:hypothetical protein